MPYNIANDTEWVESVRGISTSDQLEGGPGGVMNNTGLDLTKRTNWLKNRVNALYWLPFEDINATRAIVADDNRKAFGFRGTGNPNTVHSPTVRLREVGEGVDAYLIFDYYAPAATGITSVTAQYRVNSGSPWQDLMLSMPLSGPAVVLRTEEYASYEYRLVAVGGSGEASPVFTTSTGIAAATVAANLPALSAVAEGEGFYFVNNDAGLNQGRIFANGSERILAGGAQLASVFCKPGRGGFHIVKTGSLWRVVGESHRTEVGKVEYFAGPRIPDGYLIADGRAYSRTTFADLFEVLGTFYGNGDGSTTFNLPDLRAEFIRGWDAFRYIDGDENNPRTLGSSQADELKSHRHIVKKLNFRTTDSGQPFFGIDDQGDDGWEYTEFAGGNETRPRNISMYPCIKF